MDAARVIVNTCVAAIAPLYSQSKSTVPFFKHMPKCTILCTSSILQSLSQHFPILTRLESVVNCVSHDKLSLIPSDGKFP